MQFIDSHKCKPITFFKKGNTLLCKNEDVIFEDKVSYNIGGILPNLTFSATATINTVSYYNNYAYGMPKSPVIQDNYTTQGSFCREDYIPWRFGFNDQLRQDEVAGFMNHNTALYWEYDTRLGKRWNLDPVEEVGVSKYAVFGGNPILNKDKDGDTPTIVIGLIYGGIKGFLEMGTQVASNMANDGKKASWSSFTNAIADIDYADVAVEVGVGILDGTTLGASKALGVSKIAGEFVKGGVDWKPFTKTKGNKFKMVGGKFLLGSDKYNKDIKLALFETGAGLLGNVINDKFMKNTFTKELGDGSQFLNGTNKGNLNWRNHQIAGSIVEQLTNVPVTITLDRLKNKTNEKYFQHAYCGINDGVGSCCVKFHRELSPSTRALIGCNDKPKKK